MPNMKFADRLLKQGQGFVRRLAPTGRLLKERVIVRPIQFARPYLKKGLVMRPLLFSFIVIGVILFFLGVREYRQSSASSGASAQAQSVAAAAARNAGPVPQEIRCRDFNRGNGPSDKAYVRLTDFEFTEHYTHRKGNGGGWELVVAPAVAPREVDNPAVRVPKVLIKSNQARNSRDLYELGRRPIEGIVVKGISSFSGEDQALLRKNFSYLNLDQCWVLEAGSRPAFDATASAAAGGRTGGAGANAGSGVSAGGTRGGFGKIGGGAGLAIAAAGVLLVAGRRS